MLGHLLYVNQYFFYKLTPETFTSRWCNKINRRKRYAHHTHVFWCDGV